jgi:hypothetical protein
VNFSAHLKILKESTHKKPNPITSFFGPVSKPTAALYTGHRPTSCKSMGLHFPVSHPEWYGNLAHEDINTD